MNPPTNSKIVNIVNKKGVKIFKKEFHSLDETKVLLKSYVFLKDIPQGPISLLMSTPTFHFWIQLAENITKRMQNNENIQFLLSAFL